MKIKHLLYCTSFAMLTGLASCKKELNDGAFVNTGNFTDTTGTLKASASFPMGLSLLHQLTLTDAKYWNTARREVTSVTFGNELKNDAVLREDGTYNFTTADAFVDKVTAAGMEVFGHTLVWHSQQRVAYYNKITGSTGGGAAVNLLTVNPGFEEGTGAAFTGWSAFNGAASFSEAGAADARTGSRALKAVVAADNPGGEWRVQLASSLFQTEVGKDYRISYWVKAVANGTSAIRVSTQNGSGQNASYQGNQDVSTVYSQKEFTFTAKDAQTRMLFDLGAKANTYIIDDVTIVDASVVPAPTGPALVAAVDAAMKKHIETVVGRYKGKIKAWDVLNEPFTDGGSALRDNSNTSGPGVFVWQHYLGRGYAEKAFRYAKAVDPNALMFMNDFNLEVDPSKVDAFVKLANELKAANAGIDGVGTQMHITINTPYAGIISMMQKLAATGLKVRISELDIKMNPGKAEGFVPREMDYRNQAAMYKFVVETYMKYVPAAQRHGITVWGVDDTRTWLESADDISKGKRVFPLLFDKDFNKKPAYSGVKQALEGK